MDTAETTLKKIVSERQVRRAYHFRRYLQDLPNSDLDQYGRDAWRNFLTIDTQGKLAPLPPEHPRFLHWFRRLLHFFEETELRFGPYPAGLDGFRKELSTPHPRSMRVRSAINALDYRNFIEGKYLIKYGKHEHISAMLQEGVVRIAPASSFSDASHNDAIRDVELTFTYHLYNPSGLVLRKYDAVDLSDSAFYEGSVLLESNFERDYYMFCLSAAYDPRLFDDFQCDSCLLIREPILFLDRLLRAADSCLPHRAKGYNFGTVTYVDPFSEPDEALHYSMRKHERYSYQNELRATWEAAASMPLEIKYVKLGSLTDIAEVIHL